MGADRFLYFWAALECEVQVLITQACPTVCDPMDCSPPGFSVHGILHAKNTGVSSHSLLQGIFQTPGWNLWALAGRFFTTSATWEAPDS